MNELLDALRDAQKMTHELRMELLFPDPESPLERGFSNFPDGAGSSHFLIALSLLEQSIQHMKLSELEYRRSHEAH